MNAIFPASPRSLSLLARLTEPEDVLLSITDLFGDRVAVATSLGPQTLVVIDMLHRLGRPVPVFFLDTGLLFPETLALRARLQRRYGLEIRPVRPAHTVEEQAVDEGPRLWEREPARCCGLRKLVPMAEALSGLDAWITGLRRDQAATRASVRTVQWDARHGLVKVAPLAHWSRARVFGYLAAHGVPYNPLLEQGYASVGCRPCTRPVTLDDDERAGRWAGTGRTECGLHLPPEEDHDGEIEGLR